ncbi:MAG: antitoxin [archaeon]
MTQAVINIDERTNRVLNMVKAKFGLKDKSQAINMVVSEYEQNFLEPELRPDYKNKIEGIIKGKHLTRKELEEAV